MPKIPKKKSTKIKARRLVAQDIYTLKFPSDYSLEEVGTSQSLLQDFLSCPMKYKLSLNKYEKVGSFNGTAFGSVYHEILDKTYTLNKDTGVIASEKQIGEWLDAHPTEHPDDLENMTDQQIEWALGVIAVMMEEYKIFYADDFTKIQFTEVETIGLTKFKKFKLRRKVDGKFMLGSRKWLMEHKTKGMISEKNILLTLAFDFQNLSYITGEELDVPEPEVFGTLYNVIRRPASMQKKNESLPDFLVRLRDAIHKDPDHYFKRYEAPYTKKDKMQYRAELESILNAADRLIKGIDPVYKNTTACAPSYTCEYLDACASGNLSGYFKKTKWFPELDVGI